MKKLIIIALLLAISVVAQQNMSGIISQPVVGAFTLGAFQYCIAQDRLMLFGPTGEDVIGYNDCFRTDLFEVNGMIADCENDVCNLVTTLSDELQATNPHTSKETDMVDLLLEELDNSTDCLLRVYNGSMFNGTEGEIFVGPKTYFNTVKPCYVRTITALGGLEQIYIDEPNASFFVQKLQALEVDYQQLLTIEDLKASKTFNVSNSTLNGTVEGQAQPLGDQLDNLVLSVSETGTSPFQWTVTITDADGTIDHMAQVEIMALGPKADPNFQGNVVHSGAGVMSNTIIQVDTLNTQIGNIKVVLTPQASPATFTLTFSSATDLAGDFGVYTATDTHMENNGGYIDDSGVFALYSLPSPLPSSGATSDAPGLQSVTIQTSNGLVNYAFNNPAIWKGSVVGMIVSPNADIPTSLTLPANTVESAQADTTLAWGDTVWREILSGDLGGKIYMRDSPSTGTDLQAFALLFADDNSYTDNGKLSESAIVISDIDLAISNFVPGTINTFKVVNYANSYGDKTAFVMSVSYVNPMSSPCTTITPDDSSCSVGTLPAIATAPALNPPNGLMICTYTIQCPAKPGPTGFSYSPVGIGAPSDTINKITILTSDNDNSNNMLLETQLGVVINPNIIANPIAAGFTEAGFWQAGSSLVPPNVFNFGIAIPSGKLRMDSTILAIGPFESGPTTLWTYTGVGPVTPSGPFSTSIAGACDVTVWNTYGILDDGAAIQITYPLVADPTSIAAEGTTLNSGSDNSNKNIATIAISMGTASMPASITGSAFADLGEGNATVALLIAGVIVVILFLFVLRKKD